MSAQVADFNIRFNTETAQFNKDVEFAKKMLRGYAKEANDAEYSTSKLSKGLDVASEGFQFLKKNSVQTVGVVSAGMGSLTAAATILIKQTAEQAREIERMSNVAQISSERIQALGYASEQYNISGDKMADILKDTNDKLGDFVANGGGEFKDFFDNVAPKVGLTAQELSKLSSPEVLVAVKKAMDEANVPMKAQITYLESIADEASALMPLLENNGKQLYELTEKYRDLNVAMSDYDIKKFKEMDQKLNEVGMKLQRSFANAVLGASDQIDWFTDKLTTATDYWGSLFDSWSDSPRTENGLVKRLSELRSEVKDLTAERQQLTAELDKYSNVNQADLPSINPFGQSKNELFNLNSQYSLVTKKLEESSTELDKLQRKYNTVRFGMNYSDQPEIRTSSNSFGSGDDEETQKLQKSGATRLAALDRQYANEREKLSLAHDERLADIDKMVLSETELKRRGFDSIEALRNEYRERENDFYIQQQEEYTAKQDEAIQRELESFSRKEDEKTRKAQEAAKARADTEKRVEAQVLQMKYQVAAQGLGLIAETAKEGSLIQKAAFAAQKLMAAYTVIQQGEVAAMAALAPPPIGLGPIAGVGQAATIRGLAGVSAGIIMGQALAGMAHSGMSSIPEEGTWLLNKGERVYTNESANQIDLMYQAIMAMHQSHATRMENALVGRTAAPSQSVATQSAPIQQIFQFSAVDARGLGQMIMNHRQDIYNAVAAVKRDKGENF
ncbi:hypothetical protein K6U58_00235 [Vibrio fluvialis]|uniref:hypothetical protein n=1 Tax=Vibrio fluvialis TaxID=676 RepID=UPI001C9BCFC9|nr:hypothetical protein [Vibrio fluvialis]MBY7960026.1 hypothetical protein [Vibrio fluvialis]MCG6357024.1 hypothetical protein [Vibrio fluvialis]